MTTIGVGGHPPTPLRTGSTRTIVSMLLIVAAVAVASYGQPIQQPAPNAAAISATPAIGELNRLIAVFERRTDHTSDSINSKTLGGHLLERARLTGSLDDYRRATSAYQTAVQLAPGDNASRLGLGVSQVGLHDFRGALRSAEIVLTAEPDNPDAWLLMGDALLELGDLEAAQGALGRVSASDPAVTVRYAELSHLRGDQDGAVRLAATATDQARNLGLEGRALAFYLLLEADLLFDAGNYRAAGEVNAEALAAEPTWAAAHASTAMVAAAEGDLRAAEAAYETALQLQPGDPGWLTALGDLATLQGNLATARQHYEEAEAIYRSDDPAIYGRSLSVFLADRNTAGNEAVALAEADLARRSDIGAWDAFAWALYRAGRYEEASSAADHATGLGTQDGELLFHAGMIAAAVGDEERAVDVLTRLLDVNPAFHPIHRWTAAATLESLTN